MCIPGLSDCVQLAEAISVLSFRKQLAALPRIGCISNTRQRLYFEQIWNNSSCFSRRLRLTANVAVLDFDLQQMVWKQPWYKVVQVGFCTKCALLNTTVKLCLSGKQSAEIFLSSKPSEIGRISFHSSIFYNVFSIMYLYINQETTQIQSESFLSAIWNIMSRRFETFRVK